MSLVPDTEIDAFLETHPGWSRHGKPIARAYEFGGFSEAIGFVTRIALLSERLDHHPDIDIRWNKVTLSIFTHSEGGLTAKDLDFADLADKSATSGDARA